MSNSKVTSVLAAIGLILLAGCFAFGVCWFGAAITESAGTEEAITQTSEEVNSLLGIPSATNETACFEETNSAIADLLNYVLLIGMLVLILRALNLFRRFD